MRRILPTDKTKASGNDLIDFLINELVALPAGDERLYGEMLETALEIKVRLNNARMQRDTKPFTLAEIIPLHTTK